LELIDKTHGDFEVTEGIKLVQTDDEDEETTQQRSLNDVNLSDDQETRESEVDTLLVDRVARFLGSHTLQFKIPKDSIIDVQRSLEEGKKLIDGREKFTKLSRSFIHSTHSQLAERARRARNTCCHCFFFSS